MIEEIIGAAYAAGSLISWFPISRWIAEMFRKDMYVPYREQRPELPTDTQYLGGAILGAFAAPFWPVLVMPLWLKGHDRKALEKSKRDAEIAEAKREEQALRIKELEDIATELELDFDKKVLEAVAASKK
jgi:hypothetical protein